MDESSGNVGERQATARSATGVRLCQSIVARSPLLSPILGNWDAIDLPDAWLVAGAVAQTVWNEIFGLPPTHGIDDIDIVYFDAAELSEAAEAEHSARLQKMFADLPVRIDVKNEARVHLWHQAKFGYPIMPYRSATEAIAAFPTPATAVGLRPLKGSFDLCAPYGLSDLLGAIVRPNKKQITREVFERKADRWIALWPRLTIIDWDR